MAVPSRRTASRSSCSSGWPRCSRIALGTTARGSSTVFMSCRALVSCCISSARRRPVGRRVGCWRRRRPSVSSGRGAYGAFSRRARARRRKRASLKMSRGRVWGCYLRWRGGTRLRKSGCWAGVGRQRGWTGLTGLTGWKGQPLRVWCLIWSDRVIYGRDGWDPRRSRRGVGCWRVRGTGGRMS